MTKRIAPFVGSAVLLYAFVPFLHTTNASDLVISAALIPLIVGAAYLMPWRRLPAWCQAVLPLAYFAIIALLRDATGGHTSQLTPLVVLPVTWFALYGTRRQLAVAVGALGVMIALPVLIAGPPAYPYDELVRAVAAMAIAAAVGGAIHHLVRTVHEREAQTRSILESATEAFISMDGAGRIVEWNPQAVAEFGYTRAEVIGRNLVQTIIAPDDRVRFVDGLGQYLRGGESPIIGRRTEVAALRRDGKEFPAELNISVLETEHGPRFNVFLHDISERSEAQRALHEAKERFHRAFDDAAIGMALVAPDGRWLQVNRALAGLTGYPVSQLEGMSFREITHPEDLPKDVEALTELASGERERFQTEKRYLHADGHVIWISLNVSQVRDEAGAPLYLVSQMQDITERKAAEARLAHQASHDALTGLPNRVLFDDRLALALHRMHRRPAPLATLFLDLDRFKLINDTMGHKAGDQLLVQAANRLRRLLRSSDTVTRLGGDEFVILCEDMDEHAAAGLSARIGDALSRPYEIQGRDVAISTSIGVVITRQSDADPGSLLANADTAMYEAKRRGRSRYAFFADEMRSRAAGQFELERELRAAIPSGRIEVHYQPEVSLAHGRVVAMEALARWRHPRRGLLTASEFIPLAEESGLVSEIGDRVLREATPQLARWREEVPDLRLSFNVSAGQLADPNLPLSLSAALGEAKLDPSALSLDVTEAAVVEDPETVFETLRDLKDLGVGAALDDFGAAGSSLNLIKRLPELGALKIDGSFVEGLGQSGNRRVVATILEMARGLGMRTVAECVEAAAQAEELRGMGCDGVQGHYIARPAPAHEASEMLSAAELGELRV